MKKHHYIILIVALLTGIFCTSSSCHHKKKVTYCSGSGTCRSVLEAKDFFLFKQGSWWVYEEEITHLRDSQYVYEYNNTSGYDFDMRVLSSLENYEYYYYPFYASGALECSESEPVSGNCLLVKRNKGKIGDFVGEGTCFMFNYHLGDYKYVSNQYLDDNKIVVTNIDTTLSISGLQLENVIKVHELNTLVEGRQPTNHYFKKNIGLVRKELLDSNQVWNLVDYHIES